MHCTDRSLTGKSRLAYTPRVADVFEAIGAQARRAILDQLRERDGQTLFELCARLAMKEDLHLTRQAISQHLEVLESAGLVKTKREGRYKFHYLDTAPLEIIVERWLKSGRKGAGR
jgi:DNA-binding transcriptional ArsR family regulator